MGVVQRGSIMRLLRAAEALQGARSGLVCPMLDCAASHSRAWCSRTSCVTSAELEGQVTPQDRLA